MAVIGGRVPRKSPSNASIVAGWIMTVPRFKCELCNREMRISAGKASGQQRNYRP